jgi:hypothetical protein
VREIYTYKIKVLSDCKSVGECHLYNITNLQLLFKTTVVGDIFFFFFAFLQRMGIPGSKQFWQHVLQLHDDL